MIFREIEKKSRRGFCRVPVKFVATILGSGNPDQVFACIIPFAAVILGVNTYNANAKRGAGPDLRVIGTPGAAQFVVKQGWDDGVFSSDCHRCKAA